MLDDVYRTEGIDCGSSGQSKVKETPAWGGREGGGEGVIRRQLSICSRNNSIVVVHVPINPTGLRITSLDMFVRVFAREVS